MAYSRDEGGHAAPAIIRAGSILGWVFAVALFVAGVWYALIAEGITVADRPEFIRGSWEHVLNRFFDWYVSTLPQERLDTSIAIVAFVALIGLALAVRELLGRHRAGSLLGATAVSLGSLLWITGNVFQLGGHRAIEVLVRQNTALDPVNSIGATIDTIDDWFELFAFALLALGFVAFGLTARTERAARRWGYYAIVLAVLFAAVSATYLAENSDATNAMLFAGAIVLGPVWGVWTARLMATALHAERPEAAFIQA